MKPDPEGQTTWATYAPLIAFVSSTVLRPAVPGRTKLVITAPQTNRVTISFGRSATLDQGITLFPGQVPLELSKKDYGSALEGEISAIMAVADQAIGVLEVVAAP